MAIQCLSEGKPLPDYSLTDNFQVALRLFGRIENPAFLIFVKEIQKSRSEDNKLNVFDLMALYKTAKGTSHRNTDTETLNKLLREGMLIEGFDEVATFEEQYNFPYYKDLLEACGYEKETDWLEYKIFPSPLDERTDRIADMVLKRYNLRVVQEKSKKKFLKKYGDQLFEVIDQAYAPLHGTVPLSESVRAQILEQFELILSLKFFIAIVDENDRVIAFGFALPSLAKAVNKSKGKMLPAGIFRMLHAIKKPQVVDLALVGILPEYQGKGVNAIIMRFMANSIKKNHIQFCETNLNLEDNIKIQQQWKLFNHSQHKRRRCFIKKLDN